jgi:hypothetical protein
MVQKLKVA